MIHNQEIKTCVRNCAHELINDWRLKHYSNMSGSCDIVDNDLMGRTFQEWCQCSKKSTIAKSSLSWISWLIYVASIFLDGKATRCNYLLSSLCEKTLASAIYDAQTSNIKTLARSIWIRIGVDMNACFNISNAFVAPTFYINALFFYVNCVRGKTIFE